MNRIVGKIYRVNGPVVKLQEVKDLKLMELVMVGEEKLLGEAIEIDNQKATIQVYEDTVGLIPGGNVYGTGCPLSLELGPGMMGNIFDGVGRPLEDLKKLSGDYITRGIVADTLNRKKKWMFKPQVKAGDRIEAGSVVGEIQETRLIKHFPLVPPDISGIIVKVAPDGEYSVDQEMIVIKTADGEEKKLPFYHRWPVKLPRPVREKHLSTVPLITGERIIDTFFPISKGGCAVIPGGFGTGKTMTQHALAKWADADIIVYIGCGERGNEITEVLVDFPKLMDVKSGIPLIERTIIIANTSNMPVAAREASIYTGITIAEYYRDMGYHVAIMADSTSRWAEALREISGRLEEMPAEGGFPSYLPSRLADFYERAGFTVTLNNKEASVSIIGAVSPAGGDFSEPVTQNSLRFTRCFWALDRALASARHYPAINWITSYSEYLAELDHWFVEKVSPDFPKLRSFCMNILQEESKLEKVVKIVGASSLPEDQKLILETARFLREGYLQQNAYEHIDMYASMRRQFLMMKAIRSFYDEAEKALKYKIPVKKLVELPSAIKIQRIKHTIGNDEVEKIEDVIAEAVQEIHDLIKVYQG
ncbi:MAG: V-type ATP synthase subunit A [Candidatus Wallbacteria bacterium]|nr:V-type ATP synthase subunit A [Candidatus Wallbacteria bacterium]